MQEQISEKYSLEVLSRLTGISERNIRFYMQKKLVPRPIGEKKAAYYTTVHLEALLRVKRLAAQHIPLSEMLAFEERQERAIGPKPGSISVKSHILVDYGIELVIDPEQRKLSTDQIRQLAMNIRQTVAELTEK